MKTIKCMLSLLLVLCLVSGIAVFSFADEAEPEEKFGLLNQGTPVYSDAAAEKQGAFLGQNTVVKVLDEADGMSLIAWDKAGSFQDLSYSGTGWIKNDCYDVIEDMEPYCIQYPYERVTEVFWLCSCGLTGGPFYEYIDSRDGWYAHYHEAHDGMRASGHAVYRSFMPNPVS